MIKTSLIVMTDNCLYKYGKNTKMRSSMGYSHFTPHFHQF